MASQCRLPQQSATIAAAPPSSPPHTHTPIHARDMGDVAHSRIRWILFSFSTIRPVYYRLNKIGRMYICIEHVMDLSLKICTSGIVCHGLKVMTDEPYLRMLFLKIQHRKI